jgi:hypothetical protein
MPLLNVTKPVDIICENKKENIPLVVNIEDQNEHKWTVINDKELKKAKKSTVETTSLVYLPRTLLVKENKNKNIKPTKNVPSLSIKIIGNKNSTNNFQPSRVLAAVLGYMQYVFPDTYLGPIKD